MPTLLIIDDQSRALIKELVEFAAKPENHYIPGPNATIPGDDSRFVVQLESYRCVFTHTRAADNSIHRHLSISIQAPGRYPLPMAVETIAHLFGFTGTLYNWTPFIDGYVIVIAQQIEVLPN